MKAEQPFGDGGRKIPAVLVKTLDGSPFDTAALDNGGKPFLIVLWATWCKECRDELDAIATHYAAWSAAYGTTVFAVSCDDARSIGDVAGVVAAHAWPYVVYLDENEDFKRALAVNDLPQVFIADGSGTLVFDHNAYAPGDELRLGEILAGLARKG